MKRPYIDRSFFIIAIVLAVAIVTFIVWKIYSR